MVLTLELWPTSYPSCVLVNPSNTYKTPNSWTEYKVVCVIPEIQFLQFHEKALFPTDYRRAATPRACKAHLDRYKQDMWSPTTSVSSTSCTVTLRKRNLGKYPMLAQMCQGESPYSKQHPINTGHEYFCFHGSSTPIWSTQLKILLSDQGWKFQHFTKIKQNPLSLSHNFVVLQVILDNLYLLTDFSTSWNGRINTKHMCLRRLLRWFPKSNPSQAKKPEMQ